MTKEQAEVAVKWWADTIQNPKFDNGDRSEVGRLATLLALCYTKELSEEQVETFKNELIDIVLTEDFVRRFGIGADYQPDQFLAKALDSANISYNNVPWKTHMYFDDGKVLVKYGYSSPLMQIYPEEEKEHVQS